MLRKALMLDEFKELCRGEPKLEILGDVLAGITSFIFIFVLAVFYELGIYISVIHNIIHILEDRTTISC